MWSQDLEELKQSLNMTVDGYALHRSPWRSRELLCGEIDVSS